jgi:hypothetical protein
MEKTVKEFMGAMAEQERRAKAGADLGAVTSGTQKERRS